MKAAMMLVATVVTIATAMASPACAAVVQEGDDIEVSSHQQIALTVGMFSALGELGVAYTVAPMEDVRLEIGTGLGISGVQLSVMPKLALGDYHNVLLGLGLSVSRAGDTTIPWLNAEVGLEQRFRNHFLFSIAGGITYALGGTAAGWCFDGCGGPRPEESLRGLLLPQLRIAVGRWF